MSELMPSRQKIKVVVCGVVNAGKSSLLNVLQNQVKFEIGPVRTTDEAKTTSFSHDIELIDLPGLDANEEDDVYTLRFLKDTADVILFVHNGQEGELNALEIEWFNRFLTITDRVWLIHTHVSNVNEEENQNIKDDINQQLRQSVRQFFIDSPVYEKGIKENKKLLQAAGGVDDLKQALSESVSEWRLSLEKETELKRRIKIEEQVIITQQELKDIKEKSIVTKERLKYVEEALEEIKHIKKTISLKVELSDIGKIQMDMNRVKTSKHSSRSAVRSEAESMFYSDFKNVQELITTSNEKWKKRVESLTQYEHSDSSLSYQLEKRVLDCLRHLYYVGATNLSDMSFNWESIYDVQFSFHEVENKEEISFLHRYISEDWISQLMRFDYYIDNNLDIEKSVELKRNPSYIQYVVAPSPEWITSYEGFFSDAVRELNADLYSLNNKMNQYFEKIADERLDHFREQIEMCIGSGIDDLNIQLLIEKMRVSHQVQKLDQQKKKIRTQLKELEDHLRTSS